MKNLFPIVNDTDFLFPDNVFNNFPLSFTQPAGTTYNVPKVDIEMKDNAYILRADLPGITKEEVSVTYDDDVLTLTAKHQESADEKDEKRKYICKERMNNAYCRQFVIHDIDHEGIQANFKDGVLEIMLPKQDQKKIEEKHRITIR
ncbi:MAG: Hsp20/alpha crystallin family protein [Megasphaera sp.]|jgi:HSP20 family protein|nr:Hsp20/alpha crystallin family protein [Megasphaera sp.]MCH4187892.1 Hsp20/alpha crystallin family protein [Megasphaera sp.]MCH4218481.1 Hsp20/alpha crystallin family protein [Megasphaera sp.]